MNLNLPFAQYAPLYWQADLPVIPLRERDKMPAINQWSTFGSQMPSQIMRERWLEQFPRGNIGLPFGPASGLCAIDIDTEDEELSLAIQNICGPTPYIRIGRKGMGIIFKWEGQKNFKLRGIDGGMLCEFLGLGNQLVLPPSVHPDCSDCGTKNSAGIEGHCTSCGVASIVYRSNCNLWEVMDQIPPLGEDIEDRLRQLLVTAGFKIGAGGRSAPLDVVPAGERDVQMVKHAGHLARVVEGVECDTVSLQDGIEHMIHWVENFTAAVAGDQMDPGKGVAKLFECILKDNAKGRTLPEGWDADLEQIWLDHPMVQEIRERNAQERWSLMRMITELGDRVHQNPGDEFWIEDQIKGVLLEASKDETVTEYDVRRFHGRIQQVYPDIKLKLSDLQGLFKSARVTFSTDELDDHHAIAEAVLADLNLEGEIRFTHGQYWQWNGSCFEVLEEDDLIVRIASTVKGTPLARRNSDYTGIAQMVRRLARGHLVETHTVGINFANGYVDDKLQILPHDPAYGATFTLPFVYRPELASECRGWLGFLYDCWGHEADFPKRLLALQEMFAATLFKIAPRFQRAFLLYGKGQSGKTQILRVLEAMLPPGAVASVGPQRWNERFPLTGLIGKAANIVGELPESGRISGNMFKEVVEGSRVMTEFKTKDAIFFWPECAHWFASNFLPDSPDTSRGFSRRWLILNFNRAVPDKDKEVGLAGRLVAEEREAIAAWALEGMVRLRRQSDYTLPECHAEMISKMRRVNNSVLAFLEDCPKLKRGRGSIPLRDLYDLYTFHANDAQRGSAVKIEKFKAMLEELDLTIHTLDDATGHPASIVEGVHRA